MKIKVPRFDSSATLTNIVSFLTQPIKSGEGSSNSNNAVSSATLQPTVTTTSGDPGPSNDAQPAVTSRQSRWEWISRYPIATIFSIIVSLVVVLVIVMVLTLNSDVQALYKQLPWNVTGIAITGHNYLLDLDKRTLSIQWEIMGCVEHMLSTYQPSEHFGGSKTCGPIDRAVDVYLNDPITPAFSYDPDYLPVSQMKGPLYMQDLINFQREHQMGVYSASLYFPSTQVRHLFDQQLAAPFDDYVLNAFVFVIDKATNQSMHIIRFAAADPLSNFVTFSRDTETTNRFVYDPGNGTVMVDVESRALTLAISRSILAQAFTMCMLLVNWALTVGTLYMTLVVLVRKEKMNDAVLALPITMVLTIPVIRALFIGTPPFGILLDVAGFFLQIILVALCTLALLFAVARPPGSRQFVSEDSKRPYRGRVASFTCGDDVVRADI